MLQFQDAYVQNGEGKLEKFTVRKGVEISTFLGQGAFSTVVSAKDKRKDEEIVLKKQCQAFHLDVSRILKEIAINKHASSSRHPSICGLIDHYYIPHTDELYMVLEKMETNLHRVIHSPTMIQKSHIFWFLYQIFSGLHHMHSAGIIHRDIKPDNILVNTDCTIKICDFGLSTETNEYGRRALNPPVENVEEYIVTRWYRAPEILVCAEDYDCKVDMWAVGCMLVEMTDKVSPFRGDNHNKVLQKIISKIPHPSATALEYLTRSDTDYRNMTRSQRLLVDTNRHQLSAVNYYMKLYDDPKRGNYGSGLIDLLMQLLKWDPRERISAYDAFHHDCLEEYRGYDEDFEFPSASKFVFEEKPDSVLMDEYMEEQQQRKQIAI